MEESHLCSCREWKSTHHDQHHISTETSRLKFWHVVRIMISTKIRSPLPRKRKEASMHKAHADAIRRIGACIDSVSLYGNEDTKGARWMPWHRKSMKDAASCDKLGGGANILRSRDLRMGEPGRGHARSSAPESNRVREDNPAN